MTYAVDFETYYDNQCSIRTLGPLGYFNHPDFDAYLVSVVGDDGYEFVGNPRDFDWSLLEDQVVLSHNAGFDETLYLFGADRGWWPLVEAKEWHCTADMAVYCGHPRSLKKASEEVLGVDLSKETRDNMKGKKWDKMDPDFQKEVLEYATSDSVYCLKLWDALNKRWPEFERQVSRINRICSQRGLPIDTELLKKQKEDIALELFEVENSIPWIDYAPPLSRKAFNAECRKLGLEPPESLALSDKTANDWIRVNGKKFMWIEGVRKYRRVNALKRKLESFDYATMSNGRFYGNLMYFGASMTGRFSGSGGSLNLQNLPRGEMFGCNLRHLIATPPDKRLVVADLSQIEVRTLCWLSGAKDILEDIRNSDDIYEAFANFFGMYDGDKPLKEADPKLRHRVKTMVLGCGYGVGPKKFALISGMSEDEAEDAVDLYREKMYRVVGYWNRLARDLSKSNLTDKKYITRLPSGRRLNYGVIQSHPREGNPNRPARDHFAHIVKNSARRPVKVYGGLLAENASQALARDIFSDALVRMHNEGMQIVCHVHDEVLVEVDADEADETLDRVIEIFKTPPEWIPDIPLDAEGKVLTRYEK